MMQTGSDGIKKNNKKTTWPTLCRRKRATATASVQIIGRTSHARLERSEANQIRRRTMAS